MWSSVVASGCVATVVCKSPLFSSCFRASKRHRIKTLEKKALLCFGPPLARWGTGSTSLENYCVETVAQQFCEGEENKYDTKPASKGKRTESRKVTFAGIADTSMSTPPQPPQKNKASRNISYDLSAELEKAMKWEFLTLHPDGESNEKGTHSNTFQVGGPHAHPSAQGDPLKGKRHNKEEMLSHFKLELSARVFTIVLTFSEKGMFV